MKNLQKPLQLVPKFIFSIFLCILSSCNSGQAEKYVSENVPDQNSGMKFTSNASKSSSSSNSSSKDPVYGEPNPELILTITTQDAVELNFTHLSSISYGSSSWGKVFMIYEDNLSQKWFIKGKNTDGHYFRCLFPLPYNKIGIYTDNDTIIKRALNTELIFNIFDLYSLSPVSELSLVPMLAYPTLKEYLLNNHGASLEEKKQILENAKKSLEDTSQRIKECYKDDEFIYMGDIHDQNFLIDPKTKEMYPIDFDIMDSEFPTEEFETFEEEIFNLTQKF